MILRRFEDNREFNDYRGKREGGSVKGTGYNAAITRNHDPTPLMAVQPIRWLVMGKIEA